jgi:hypothetical protein
MGRQRFGSSRSWWTDNVPLAFDRDTGHPSWGGDSIAAGRSSTNCLATQGWMVSNGLPAS